LKKLQQSVVATPEEMLELIEREQLQDLGCGAVAVSLLASVLLTSDTLLWTVDKNLDALSTRMGVAFRRRSSTISWLGHPLKFLWEELAQH
jgi:hypothetical protein